MFAEIIFCPSINLDIPVMVLILFLTSQLSYGIRYLILSVLAGLTGFKMRIQARFCIVQLLHKMNIVSLNISYLVQFIRMGYAF